MWKKIGKFLLAIIGIAISVFTIFTLYKTKKKNEVEDDEFSDIFEEEDYDLDESL